MSYYHNMDWDLSVFEEDDLVDPYAIIKGENPEMPNKDAAVVHAVMSATVHLLTQRAKDLAVPRTSDEANQIWVGEVENFVIFAEQNFPVEMLVYTVREVARIVAFPDNDIAPSPNFNRVVAQYSQFLL